MQISHNYWTNHKSSSEYPRGLKCDVLTPHQGHFVNVESLVSIAKKMTSQGSNHHCRRRSPSYFYVNGEKTLTSTIPKELSNLLHVSKPHVRKSPKGKVPFWRQGVTINQRKPLASLFDQSVCFKLVEGLETWRAGSLLLLALACSQNIAHDTMSWLMQPQPLSSERRKMKCTYFRKCDICFCWKTNLSFSLAYSLFLYHCICWTNACY